MEYNRTKPIRMSRRTSTASARAGMWYTAEDEKVCPCCSELDGEVIGIEDAFFKDDYSDGTAAGYF
jgi:hypothetical protein